jgi:hypothetical protein
MFVYDSIHDFNYINMNKYSLIYKLSMIIELDTKWLLLTVKDLAANQHVWYWIEMQFTFTDSPNKFDLGLYSWLFQTKLLETGAREAGQKRFILHLYFFESRIL